MSYRRFFSTFGRLAHGRNPENHLLFSSRRGADIDVLGRGRSGSKQRLHTSAGLQGLATENVVVKLRYPQDLTKVVSEDNLKTLLSSFYKTQDLVNYQWTLYAPVTSTIFCDTGPKPLQLSGSSALDTSPTIIIDMYHNISNPDIVETVATGVQKLVREQLCKGCSNIDVFLLQYFLGKVT